MDFAQSANVFLQYIKSILPELMSLVPTRKSTNKKIGIVVTPWQFTPVPWFSIVLGLIYRSKGYDVCLIWDDLIVLDSKEIIIQNKIIFEVLADLLKKMGNSHLTACQLSQITDAELTDADKLEIRKAARFNTIRKFCTTDTTPDTIEYERILFDRLNGNYRKIKNVFNMCKWDHLIIPGGNYSNTSMYIGAGNKMNIRVAAFDSGPGMLLIGVDDAAGYFADITKIMERQELFSEDLIAKERAIKFGQEEFGLRLKNKSTLYPFQVTAYSDEPYKEKFDVLIPLNIDFDSAAFGKHVIFEESFQWVAETVKFILEKTRASVAVRQHPGERDLPRNDDLKNSLNQLFGHDIRFRFISCDESINTYNLLDKAKVVLPYVSTIGIEAALMGKSVIVESCGYYSNMSFVQRANNKEQYFEKIIKCLEEPEILNEKQKEEAWLCYYFTQVANFIRLDFTPFPEDFLNWTKLKFVDLLNDKMVNLVFQALSEGIPAACLNSAIILSEPEVPISDIQTATLSSQYVDSDDLQNYFSNISFGKNVQIIGMKNVRIGEGSCVSDDVWINVCIRDDKVRMNIGRCVLIGRQSMISTGGYLEIGDYCVFAPRVYVSDADHVFADVRTPIIWQGATTGRSVVVEENCWLGVNSVISGNLTIGRGSVVAANSVVLNDVPPFCVVAGTPARIVKILNSQTGHWEKTKTPEEQSGILSLRHQFPIPDRMEYNRILKQNAKGNKIDPLIAGRGMSI